MHQLGQMCAQDKFVFPGAALLIVSCSPALCTPIKPLLQSEQTLWWFLEMYSPANFDLWCARSRCRIGSAGEWAEEWSGRTRGASLLEFSLSALVCCVERASPRKTRKGPACDFRACICMRWASKMTSDTNHTSTNTCCFIVFTVCTAC